MKPRVSRGQAASRLAPTPAARLSPQDEHIFRELMERFAVLSEMCFRFSLTHKGIVIARLGEPVFLYLRLAEGWNTPTSEVRPTAEAEGAEKAAGIHAEART